MKFNQVIALISALVLSGICANNVGLSYTDSLVGGLGNHGVSGLAAEPVLSGKGLVGSAFDRICHLDCPFGTRCSMDFGAPRCVGVSEPGLGGYLDNGVGGGLDLPSRHPIGLDSALVKRNELFGFGRCTPMTPACLATRFDRFEQCRYTFDLHLRRCVKVYVRNICAIFDGPRRNLFSSRFECERSCVGRLTY